MTDLTAENLAHSGGDSRGGDGTSDAEINAQLDVDMAEALDADRSGEDEASAEPSEFDERSDSNGYLDA